MMTYGDCVADINLKELLKFHVNHGKIATVTGIYAASRFGELKIERDNVLDSGEPECGSGVHFEALEWAYGDIS
jgi:NDP-sugar pyrophosphorylase family protein